MEIWKSRTRGYGPVELTPAQTETIELMGKATYAEVRGTADGVEDGRVMVRGWTQLPWKGGPNDSTGLLGSMFLDEDGLFVSQTTIKEGAAVGISREDVLRLNTGVYLRWQAWRSALREHAATL